MAKTAKNENKLCKIISNKKEYDEFVKILKSLSKNESVNDLARHKAILNTNQEVIGISMKNIRDVAKQISKYSQFEFLNIAKHKKPQDVYYEETLIEGLVIAEIKDLNLQFDLIKEWSEKIDNWSTCDSVVTSLKRLKKSKEKDLYFDKYKSLCKSEKEFVARFGIVTLMSVFLDKTHIDEIFALIKEIKSNAYYIMMAQAWLIATAFIVDSTKTYKLLSEKCLNKFVQNKAISKCRDSFQVSREDKEKLKLLRI